MSPEPGCVIHAQISEKDSDAGHALLRAGPGAWMNAVISALSMAPDEALIDMLQVAYRVNRDRLLDEVVRGTDGFGDRVAAERILALLDRAIVIQDDLDRTPGFVLRLTSDDGMVREIVVGEDPWMR